MTIWTAGCRPSRASAPGCWSWRNAGSDRSSFPKTDLFAAHNATSGCSSSRIVGLVLRWHSGDCAWTVIVHRYLLRHWSVCPPHLAVGSMSDNLENRELRVIFDWSREIAWPIRHGCRSTTAPVSERNNHRARCRANRAEPALCHRLAGILRASDNMSSSRCTA